MKPRQVLFIAVLLPTAAGQNPPGQPAIDPSEAVVRIIGEGVSVTKDTLGTGFFISPDGAVLTCYHVIVDARDIDVVVDGVHHRNVLVTGIAPDDDLAELQVSHLANRVHAQSR
jgi:S1-C subfamily serine protease